MIDRVRITIPLVLSLAAVASSRESKETKAKPRDWSD
jgi:hypothetical protein